MIRQPGQRFLVRPMALTIMHGQCGGGAAAVMMTAALLLHVRSSGAAWPPCAGPAAARDGEADNITDVHLVMMNHLDVGFGEQNGTQPGFINNVLNMYFEVYFPRAVRVAQELHAQGGKIKSISIKSVELCRRSVLNIQADADLQFSFYLY